MAITANYLAEFRQRSADVLSSLSPKERSSYSIANLILKEAEFALRQRTPAVDIEKKLMAVQHGFAMPVESKPAVAPRGLEHEVSQYLEGAFKGAARNGGVLVPLCMRSGLDTKTSAAGGATVGKPIEDLVDALIAQSRVLSLGAIFAPGLSGTESWPVEATAPVPYWVTENSGSDVTQADPVFGQRQMNPKMLSGTTSYSRTWLQQNSVGGNAFLAKSLTRVHAAGIDQAAINGLSANGQPVGVLNTSGIGDVAIGAAGGAPTAAAISALERLVSVANADSRSNAYLTTPVMREKLRTIAKFTGGAVALWDNNRMLDYTAEVSSNVPSNLVKSTSTDCHAILFGSWDQLLIGEFGGGLELVIDPYRLKKMGMIECTSYQMIDVAVLQPSAFAAVKDARNV